MHDAAAISAPAIEQSARFETIVRSSIPTLAESSLATGSAILLVLSFPDFDLWWLAWVGLVPLLFAVATTYRSGRAFLLGWLWGIIFFYGTCWWLTYPMIHYAPLAGDRHISAPLAYLLLLIPVLFVALFPALFCLLLFRVENRFGQMAILAAPLIWVSVEWLRYEITGQVWNTIGYSQAFHPLMIQTSRLGGVYAVTLLVLAVNVALSILVLGPRRRFILVSGLTLLGSLLVIIVWSYPLCCNYSDERSNPANDIVVIAIQPNVPMGEIDANVFQQLLDRHIELTKAGLSKTSSAGAGRRLVIWPESPMNFSYSRDPNLQSIVGNFAKTNNAAVLMNSLEPAIDGGFNSAILINEQGEKVAQYDKIRLMPFGEYVPLPRWLPGASSVRALVGEFQPGSSYTLMPLGAIRAGVFICIEAAHPSIARAFTNEGADVLINISNDGYLGPTPVMRQHLANAIFRAVENDRPLLRVTNSGITAYVNSNGAVVDETAGFQATVRTWTVGKNSAETTFYTRHDDLFVYACATISLGIVAASFRRRRTVH
jgi:apolipoprotein N-acyltransferase